MLLNGIEYALGRNPSSAVFAMQSKPKKAAPQGLRDRLILVSGPVISNGRLTSVRMAK